MAAIDPRFDLVNVFKGDCADQAEAEAMARKIGSILPGVEVEVRHGGQPFYRYLIAAE
jgi:dihydroxyacetone kinase-like predicted kinase